MSEKSTEIRIPVPYGSISAKAWGTPSDTSRKMLALHGWQDNASSFDKLIPLLDLESIYVIAIDLPGHALSSHLPAGDHPYTDLTWVLGVKRVVDGLNWSRLSLLGHSMGGNIAINFAVLFPSYVDSVVCIDSFVPRIHRKEDVADLMREEVRNFAELVAHNENLQQKASGDQQLVSYARAINKLILIHSNVCDITADVAKALLKRAFTVTSNGVNKAFQFNGDYRLTAMIYPKTDLETMLKYLSELRCETLVINAKNGIKYNKPFERHLFELCAKQCSKFSAVEEDGDHYLHIANPYNVAKHVNEFLKK